MINYVPRPGSKTDAEFRFLNTQGGAATDADIAEAIDTDRKNLRAIFSAAVSGQKLERCELDGGFGYRLIDATAGWATAEPGGVGRMGEMEARPCLGATPKPATVARAPKPSRPTGVPAPSSALRFRAGEFSDGYLRLEGDSAEIDILTGHAVSWVQINLSPAAASALREYLGARP